MGVKVGDKVRSLVTEFDVREGGIYEVETVGSDGAWVIDDVEDNYYLCNDQFEPVAVADSNGNRFKVGDRVRCIDDSGTTRVARGGVYTVEGIKGKFITVRGDNMYYYRFEPVDAPLTIHSGKFYRTRDGRKVGPMVDTGRGWLLDDRDYSYYQNGKRLGNVYGDEIIAEWTDEPVAAGGSNSNDTIDDWYFGKTAGYTVPLCAMEDDAPKFKVGDRVEIIDVGSCPERYLGTQFTIDSDEDDFDGEQAWSGKDHNSPYRFKESQLRLVAEATTAQEPPTTIADIVRRLERLEREVDAPDHAIGAKVTLRATVTGKQKKTRVNITLDDVSGAAHSLVVPASALTAA